MPGLCPGIHVFLQCFKDLDGRDKPGMTTTGGVNPKKVRRSSYHIPDWSTSHMCSNTWPWVSLASARKCFAPFET